MMSAHKLSKQGDSTDLMYYFLNLEPVSCSKSSSNCCFLTCNTGFSGDRYGCLIIPVSLRIFYVDNTTLMVESEEELKSLLMRVKEESEKSWLETQHFHLYSL